MPIVITCQCGSDDLTEIPSGENSVSYECGKCGGGLLIQYFGPPDEEIHNAVPLNQKSEEVLP